MKYPQLISILLFTISKFCLADDTLSPGLTLSDGQTLISPGEVMELGFFTPGTSKSKFLGIWYKNIPDIVVWVANRNSPIIDSKGVFTVRSNGTLVLSTIENTILWSSSSYRETSNPILKLLDNGNLVLLDEASMISYIWQSFDLPGDTRLPEMQIVRNNLDSGLDKYLTSWKSEDDPSTGDFVYRIENKELPQITILMGTEKIYRTGPWNGYDFTGLPLFSAPAFTTEVVFGENGMISISEPYNSSIITRLIMNYSGSAQRYIMNEEKNAWTLVFKVPSDPCDNYGHCGPNGICQIYEIPICECLIGYKPKSQRQWSMLDWSSGCTRIPPSDCQQEDGFLKVDRVKFPDPLNFKLNDSMSFGECKYECLKQCNCTAFADPYIINRSGGCLMWFGDLIDVRELTGKVTYSPSINIRVPISELANTTDIWNEKKKEKKKRLSKAIIVGITTGIGLLVLLLVSVGTIILRTRRNGQASRKKQEDLELPLYDFTKIAAATNNFSRENVIGEGGFGPVYKGDLSAGQVIAVKRMSRSSGQGPEEFRNEVILIAKLQHRNLVRILGCCIKGEERMLIYEYMENRSLDSFIFDQNRRALLTWPKRFDIIMGITRGLLYLHRDSRLKVIHRDLKTSNILLDGNLNAKISDFGIARMFEGDQTTARTKRVVGTYGYMAPEYVFDGRYSIKSDVFSLGVVLLEIVSGKKNRGFYHGVHSENLLDQAWLLWKENRELELMDACYSNTCVEIQVKRCIQVGLFCVQCMEEDRPDMSSVLLMLSSEDNTTSHPPKEPGSFIENYSKISLKNISGSVEHSNGNMMAITEVQAR